MTAVYEQIRDAIEAIARQAAEAEATAGHFSVEGSPLVEMDIDGDRVTFVFDFMLLFSTISGSDWYRHHVVSGTARIDGGELADVTTVKRLEEHVTEHEAEWANPRYDRHAVLRNLKARISE